MNTMQFSRTEIEALSLYWEMYIRLRHEEWPPEEEKRLNRIMEQALEHLSDESRDAFLTALDNFELTGEEFQVCVALDDVNLVN